MFNRKKYLDTHFFNANLSSIGDAHQRVAVNALRIVLQDLLKNIDTEHTRAIDAYLKKHGSDNEKKLFIALDKELEKIREFESKIYDLIENSMMISALPPTFETNNTFGFFVTLLKRAIQAFKDSVYLAYQREAFKPYGGYPFFDDISKNLDKLVEQFGSVQLQPFIPTPPPIIPIPSRNLGAGEQEEEMPHIIEPTPPIIPIPSRNLGAGEQEEEMPHIIEPTPPIIPIPSRNLGPGEQEKKRPKTIDPKIRFIDDLNFYIQNRYNLAADQGKTISREMANALEVGNIPKTFVGNYKHWWVNFFGGHSAKEKLVAAIKMRNSLTNPQIRITESDYRALMSSDLKAIVLKHEKQWPNNFKETKMEVDAKDALNFVHIKAGK